MRDFIALAPFVITDCVVGLASSIGAEEEASQRELQKQHAEVAGIVSAIVDDLERTAPEHFDPAPTDDDFDSSLEQIRAWLVHATAAVPAAFLVGKQRTDRNELATAISYVKDVADRAGRPELQERLCAAERRFDHANRERRIFYLTSTGTALVMLERHLGDLHPPPVKQSQEAELARLARMHDSPLGRVAETLFGVGRTVPEKDLVVSAVLDGIRSDIKRVYEDIRARLGAERSLLAVFERYRQRSVWYDADRLRAIAKFGPGKPEDRLTETLAAYLFEHGLNPLTRPMIGRVQPDLLAPGTQFSFYVEAKQYARAARGYLLKGVHQVWDMLDELRGTDFDVTEAFLVIYRRGGPRYSFEPRISHRGRVVHILVVDIAESGERGSNAPPTQTFEEKDLLPTPVPAQPRRSRSAAPSSRKRSR